MSEIHAYLSNSLFFQLGLLVALSVAAVAIVSMLDAWVQDWRRRRSSDGEG